MKIECSQQKLKEIVEQASRISSKHATLPVLSCLLFDASKKNQLIVRATNLDLGIEISTTVKTIEEGVVAIPSSTINSFLINAVADEKGVVLETTQGNVKIDTTHNSGLIKMMPHEDFPSIPKISSSDVFILNSNDFVKGLRSVWYSSSVSSIKPELSSVYIYCDGDFVVFVATDSFRLAEKKIKIKKSKEFGQILLPYKNIPDIIKILESINDDVEVCLDKNQISFNYKGIYLISRVIDGTFPDYKQIIPKTSTTDVIVLKQDFVNTLKLSNVFSDKFNQINIKVDPSAKKTQIKTKNNDVGENTTVLDSAITGEAVDINFNYKYISDCFQSIDSDSVSLTFNGLNKPVIISPVSDTTFRYIVMPMNR